jgi:hypothetical protein
MKIAEQELDEEFSDNKILGVFISFRKAMLVNNNNPIYFRYWMMSKVLFALTRKLEKKCGISKKSIIRNYYEDTSSDEKDEKDESIITKLEQLKCELEKINNSGLTNEEIKKLADDVSNTLYMMKDLEYFHSLIEDLCEENGVDRIVLFFDEACHNFIPYQQREFFIFFRDLRSPYLCCKAAVYPGLSSYGTFQAFHDAEIIDINRDITNENYVKNMREIIKKQISDNEYQGLVQHGEVFNALIYSASGNPRLLLKSLSKATVDFTKSISKKGVTEVIKDFYRSDIWSEHTKVSNLYPAIKNHVDWGRNFIEEVVINDTTQKNIDWADKERQTCYFCIHKDAPVSIKKSIQILEYSGIVYLHTEATKVRGQVFDRYALNIGVLVANSANPVDYINQIISNLSVKLYTDYGMTSPKYGNLDDLHNLNDAEITNYALSIALKTKVDELDLTQFQLRTLKCNNILTINDILSKSEMDLKKFDRIGVVRSRKIWNAAYNAFFEYISG